MSFYIYVGNLRRTTLYEVCLKSFNCIVIKVFKLIKETFYNTGISRNCGRILPKKNHNIIT